MASRRPEHSAPPEIFYNETEARKYTQNKHMAKIQTDMTERALELLALPEDLRSVVLDLGCGSGLSGSVLEEYGHFFVGLDISKDMIDIALERDVEGELVLNDLGQGIPLRASVFDGAISISALQWLCNADKTSHNPVKRLYTFFSTLYATLTKTARAVFQFYPENPHQIELIMSQATKAGFSGGLVVDFPHSTKAKKYFLVLMVGGSAPLPKALGTGNDKETGPYTSQRQTFNRAKGGKPGKKTKEWILEKKERRRRQGLEVREHSKFTARRRCGKF